MGKRKKLIIILIIIISILIVATVAGMIIYNMTKEKEKSKTETAEAKAFNEQFLEYEKQDATTKEINDLILKVIQSNTDNLNQKISMQIENSEPTMDPATLVIEQRTLMPDSTYTITFNYDSKKYINLIFITKNTTEESKKIFEFNRKFIQYEGENISATLVKSLLTEILQSNKENEKHQIVVKIIGTELEKATVNTDNLTRVQEKIQEPTRYKAEFQYGNDGYISSVIIEQIENTDNIGTNL